MVFYLCYDFLLPFEGILLLLLDSRGLLSLGWIQLRLSKSDGLGSNFQNLVGVHHSDQLFDRIFLWRGKVDLLILGLRSHVCCRFCSNAVNLQVAWFCSFSTEAKGFGSMICEKSTSYRMRVRSRFNRKINVSDLHYHPRVNNLSRSNEKGSSWSQR